MIHSLTRDQAFANFTEYDNRLSVAVIDQASGYVKAIDSNLNPFTALAALAALNGRPAMILVDLPPDVYELVTFEIRDYHPDELEQYRFTPPVTYGLKSFTMRKQQL